MGLSVFFPPARQKICSYLQPSAINFLLFRGLRFCGFLQCAENVKAQSGANFAA
jgi:hypothetical protein